MVCTETLPIVDRETGYFSWKKPVAVIMEHSWPNAWKLIGAQVLKGNICVFGESLSRRL